MAAAAAASSSSSSSCSYILFAVFMTTLIYASNAKNFLVGGSIHSWKIPASPEDSLNKWAESSRFQINDSLVWKYDAKKDSVLQVTRKDYLSCNTASPLKEYKDGQTVIKLHRSGPYYIISGAKGACENGEKLIVVVMAHRKYRHGIAPAPSMMVEGPALGPSAGGAGLRMVVGWSCLYGVLIVLGLLLV